MKGRRVLIDFPDNGSNAPYYNKSHFTADVRKGLRDWVFCYVSSLILIYSFIYLLPVIL